MNTNLHAEITCPYCRMQFGGYKIYKGNIEHLDMFWSYDNAMSQNCTQQEYIKENIINIDGNQNPTFNEDFKSKLNDLKDKFYSMPDDISKENFSWNDYFLAFCNCMNWGWVEEDNEEYDRESMTTDNLKELYENGYNLYQALRFYIKESVEEIEEETKEEEIVEKIIHKTLFEKCINKIKNILWNN